MPEENYWFRRHEAAYLFALDVVAHARVLEVGCGEGYGAALLAGAADQVIGIDYDALTVAHAAATYADARFVRANLAALPLPDRSFDVVATLQVIEHVWNHREFLTECRRVLRPGGRLIVTTPNRLTFSPGRDTPANLFHTKEFTAGELIELLSACGFAVGSVYGLHAGDRLAALDAVHGGSFVEAQLETAPAQWSAALRQAVAAVAASDFEIWPAAQRSVDRSLDLVVTAERRRAAGDPKG